MVAGWKRARIKPVYNFVDGEWFCEWSAGGRIVGSEQLHKQYVKRGGKDLVEYTDSFGHMVKSREVEYIER